MATQLLVQPNSRLLESYRQRSSYPENLIDRSADAGKLKLCRHRLNDPSTRLCTDKELEIDVSFRDFYVGDSVCSKQNVQSPRELAEWLGDLTANTTNSEITKEDPKCRFIFLFAPTSRAALQVTRSMLKRILSYHQVPAQYLELLFLFGSHFLGSDLKFGSFWKNSCLRRPRQDLKETSLGRSGKHYEICFNLKCVEQRQETNPRSLEEWSIRHTVIYHKFDVDNEGGTLWLMTKARSVGRGSDLKDLIKGATDDITKTETRNFDNVNSSYQSSLGILILLARWCTESWWQYLQMLETELHEKTKHALITDVTQHYLSTAKNDATMRPEDLQDVLHYGELASQAAAVLETNYDVLRALRKYYENLILDTNFPLNKDNSNVTITHTFTQQLEEIESEFRTKISRAKYLAEKATNRKELIFLLMQIDNANTMRGMTKRSIDEAIAMRIITVVTLIYLPATFVSTFFSSDVVKYQPGGNDVESYHTQYSSLAMERWVEVALPLTLITLFLAGCWYIYTQRRSRQDRFMC